MKEKLGLIHIYCGDGKGKTTASMGLAVRAIGHGFRVVITQFLKDGNSSELKVLSTFENATIISGKDVVGFSFQMSEEEKAIVTKNHNDHLNQAIEICEKGECDVLVLDELLSAISTKLIDYDRLIGFLNNKPAQLEVIITGRNPNAELLELADYVCDIHKVKHPYDRGVSARGGIEF